MSDTLTIAETAGVRYLEGPAESELLRKVSDVNLVMEACFSARIRSALLYAPNMTARFFESSDAAREWLA